MLWTLFYFQELTNIKLIFIFFLLRVFFFLLSLFCLLFFFFYLWSLSFIFFLLSLFCLLFFYCNRNSSLIRVYSTIIYNKCKIVLSGVILIRSIGYCVGRWVHIP